MAKYGTLACEINIAGKSLDFYLRMPESTEAVFESVPIRSRIPDVKFYEDFNTCLVGYFERNALPVQAGVTVILPDIAVFSDFMSVPAMGLFGKGNPLNSTLNGLYKNVGELKIVSELAASGNKQSTYSIFGVRKEIIAAFGAACAQAKIPLKGITFASSVTASVCGVLNPKLKSASYLFLDIGGSFTRIVSVNRGKAVGFSSLPFGQELLEKDRVIAENMLFNHNVAELAVLNAREKAKMKSLTMMGEENANAIEEATDGTEKEEAEEQSEETENSFENGNSFGGKTDSTIKVLPKKVPRKLPKSLTRPNPESREETQYENFRTFLKWTLGFLAENTRLGTPEAVYVNLPERFSFLYEMINREEEENGIRFLPAELDSSDETALAHLSVYGEVCGKKGYSPVRF